MREAIELYHPEKGHHVHLSIKFWHGKAWVIVGRIRRGQGFPTQTDKEFDTEEQAEKNFDRRLRGYRATGYIELSGENRLWEPKFIPLPASILAYLEVYPRTAVTKIILNYKHSIHCRERKRDVLNAIGALHKAGYVYLTGPAKLRVVNLISDEVAE